MIACPACGFEAPDEYAFCPKCATALKTPLAIAEERKTVTALFCDLVAFTAMSESADPEDVDRLLGEYFARATKAIEAHGGTVEKFIGDAVFGVFGVPAVHEDDPERAVRAALSLLEALKGLTRPDGSPLEARCGVNTGEALVRLDVHPASGLGFLRGDAVNTAARLQAAAPPMGVVVGALTRELTRNAIVCAPLAPLIAKGKREPLQVWLARESVVSRSRTGLRTGGKLDTPFLGREAELRRLLAARQAAVSTGTMQCVLVIGEPGIGKSRLVLELAKALEQLPDAVIWRQGRCLAYGDASGFAALSEILKAHAGILDSDDVATVEEKLEAVLPEGEDRPWLRQRLRPLLGLEASQAAQEERFVAWTRFLHHLASSAPTVLVLEDLHWAGEGMLAFVQHLAARELEAPLLLVATTRPELLARRPEALAPSERVSRLTLAPLAEEAASRLVSALLDDHLAADLRRPILEHVGGNPLYAEEYVRLLLDRGLLLKARGVLRLREGEELPLPGSVQAVLAARLDTLPPAHKALLCDAAVFGETFWDGGVTTLSGRSADEVEEAMAALAQRQLVRLAVSSSLAGEREYLFWHALTRDVAYGELPRRVRARKHAAAAGWFEKRAGERPEEYAEILAQHYATALELARAAGDEDLASPLLAPTIRWLARAGERALRFDAQAATRYFERGLAVGGEREGGRGRLLCGLGDAMFHTGDLLEGAELLCRADDACRREGDVAGEARAKWLLSLHLTFMCQPGGDALIDEAVGLIAALAPSPVTLEILNHKAFLDWVRNERPAELLAACDRIVALARELGEPAPVHILARSYMARIELGDLSAVDDHERLLATALARGLWQESVGLMEGRGFFLTSTEGPARARESLLEAVDLATSRGLMSSAVTDQGLLFEALWLGGQWHEALAAFERASAAQAAVQDVWDLAATKVGGAFLLLLQGKAAAARPLVEWAAANNQAEYPWLVTLVLAVEAALHFATGEGDKAREALSRWAGRRCTPNDASGTAFGLIAIRMALDLSDVKLAERIAATRRGRLPLNDLARGSMTALLAEARGEHEAAAAGFADAAARWHDFGVPYEEAHALFGQARCLAALGRAQQATIGLRQALEIFRRLGAKPALAETDALLERLSGTSQF